MYSVHNVHVLVRFGAHKSEASHPGIHSEIRMCGDVILKRRMRSTLWSGGMRHSFTSTGMPCNGPRTRQWRRFSSSTCACLSKTGFVTGKPMDSDKFIKKILVASIQGQTKDTIEPTILSTSIQNSDRSWNCQHWVGDASTKLVQMGWITSGERFNGINDMAGVVAEAPHES